MHESGALKWRDVVEKHHSHLLDELSGQFHSDLQQAVAAALTAERAQFALQTMRACDDARRSHAELLNQALRRLRSAGAQEEVLQFLSEACAPLSSRTVVVVFENSQARSTTGEICFTIADAPAMISAIESREPVIALASSEEISAPLAKAFRDEEAEDRSGKAYLFPVVARHAVVAMLIASGRVEEAPIELLSGAAGLRVEALAAPDPARSSNRNGAWEDLSPEEQKIHLQAQRVARVRVARMRLDGEAEWRQGLAGSDIYKALRGPIDLARQEFLQTFLSQSPTMVDYLHLELVRTLANDDDRLLGTDYPGPMV